MLAERRPCAAAMLTSPGQARMLNRLPLGSCPARSAAAVTLDDRFVAELTGPLGVDFEVDAPPEDAVEVFELLLP